MKVTKNLIPLFLSFLAILASLPLLAEDLNQEIEKGRTIMKSGDFKKSAELFNILLTKKKEELKNHPRHAEAWYLFSVSLRKLGRINLADKALSRAKILKQSSQKDKAKSTNNESEDHADFSDASDSSDTASEKTVENPEKTDTTSDNSSDSVEPNIYDLPSLKNETAKQHHRKGAAHQEAGQLQAAADEFILANAAEPGNIELLEKTAAILDQIGGSYYQKAQQIYLDLEKANPQKLTAKQKAAYARACIFSGKPDHSKAELILKELTAAEPENVEIIILSAQLDSEKKLYKEAVAKFEKAMKLDKNNMDAYLGLGDSYQKMKQFPKAIEVLQQAKSMWPDSFMPLVSLGKAYLKNGDKGFALVMFNRAAELNQDSFDVNLGLLEIYAQNADYRANNHISRCEKIFKGDPRVEFWKAIFMELDERPEEARKIYSLLAMYEDEVAYKARLRIGQMYAGIGHQTFPGNQLVVERPRFIRVYQSMFDQEMAFFYLQSFLDKRADAPEAVSVRRWLDENEEAVRSAREFDALIQSQFSSN